MLKDCKIEKCSIALASEAGIRGEIEIEPMLSGANNRVFRLHNQFSSYLLKHYFRDLKDPRDRLGTEFSFLTYAWKKNPAAVPRPVARDQAHLLGLYEFVEGRKLSPGEVKGDHVRQAIDFFQMLNLDKAAPDARALPASSEACFSVNDHIRCVDARLEQWREVRATDPVTGKAVRFVQSELSPAWEREKIRVRKVGAAQFAADPNHAISFEDRCLSPSDFGFHNAIMEGSGTLRFIDFEYAGWDDPAKMICDFFCQPAVPVPGAYLTPFLDAVAACCLHPEALGKRFMLLYPLHRLKWCCIMLNDFLRVGSKRREFSKDTDPRARKTEQLEKARSYFHRFAEAL